MNYIDMPIDYHIWGAMLEHCYRYIPKLTNIYELEDCVVDDMEWFATVDTKAIISFCNRLQSCVVAAAGHTEHSCLNTNWAIYSIW